MLRFAMTRQTVLLLHSGGFSSRQWRRLAEMLSSDYRVLAPDLLGYGESGPWPDREPFHFRQDLAFLESLIGEEPVHLAGHSYGGFLALQLAISHPKGVRSIAVFDPVAFGILDRVEDADVRQALSLVKQDWESLDGRADESWLEAFVDWWNGIGSWTRLPEETRATFRAVGWKVFQEVLSLIADQTDRRVVEKLGAALPHATVQFFPNVGHMGPISHASLVNAAIAGHVRNS